MFPEMIEDAPIKRVKEDLLGRGHIVGKIVETIIARSKVNGNNCYALGIYGKWGEGKTSLLNMVCEQLRESEEKNINIIHFNPWLFKDQESLLLDFFKALEKGNSKEVVEKIKQYGPLVSLGISGLLNIAMPGLGNIFGNSLKQVTKAVSKIDIDIRTLKKELNESIQRSEKHLLVLIDDVDRLDNEEMHALFKLIRQNADFVNTTYIIAMDVDMVAKSIRQRFENGDEQSGRRFLEKIIQVPIYLPKIQRGHISKLFISSIFPLFEKLESSSSNGATPQLEELKESLEKYALPLFSTVREIKLYANSLSLLLPFIYREVNLSDLCLLEVFKLFHSEGYDLIRENKYLLTGTESEISFKYAIESSEAKQGRKDTFIDRLLKDANPEKRIILEGIADKLLYPYFSKNSVTTGLNNEKRLCSPVYFDKYFLYTSPDDIISDCEYDDLLEKIPKMEEDEVLHKFEFYYNHYGYGELRRIVFQILYVKFSKGIDNDCVEKICIVLSRLEINKRRVHYTEGSLSAHVEFDLCDIIGRYVNDWNEDADFGERVIPNYKKQLEIIEGILSEKELLPFHLFLATHYCDKCSTYYSVQEESDRIVYRLIRRYITQKGLDSLFILSQMPITILFGIWKNINPEEYHKEVNEYIAKDDFDMERLVRKMIYNSDPQYYEAFCKLFDEDIVYNKVKNIPVNKIRDYQTTIGYFIKMYENKRQSKIN